MKALRLFIKVLVAWPIMIIIVPIWSIIYAATMVIDEIDGILGKLNLPNPMDKRGDGEP